LVKVIKSNIGGIAVAGIAGAGLSFGSYNYVVAPFRDHVAQELGGAGAQMLNWLGFCGVDKFITIVFSAIAARATIEATRLSLQRLRINEA
jgi:hypothetical protein